MVIPHLVRNRLPAMDEKQIPDVPLHQTTLQTKLHDQKYGGFNSEVHNSTEIGKAASYL